MRLISCNGGSRGKGVVSPYLGRKDSADFLSREFPKLARVLSLSSPMFSGSSEKKEKEKEKLKRKRKELNFSLVPDRFFNWLV